MIFKLTRIMKNRLRNSRLMKTKKTWHLNSTKSWVKKNFSFVLKLELANVFYNWPDNKHVTLSGPYWGYCDFSSQFLYPQISHRYQYISEWYICIPAQLNLQKLVAILIRSRSISFSTLPSTPQIKDIKDVCGTVGTFE